MIKGQWYQFRDNEEIKNYLRDLPTKLRYDAYDYMMEVNKFINCVGLRPFKVESVINGTVTNISVHPCHQYAKEINDESLLESFEFYMIEPEQQEYFQLCDPELSKSYKIADLKLKIVSHKKRISKLEAELKEVEND